MQRLHRLTPAAADRLREQAPTYDAIGATLRGETPDGFRLLEYHSFLGRGPDLFARSADALLGWQLQLRSGIAVRASTAVVEPGAVAMLRIGVGPIAVPAPARVVAVVDEPARRGFAYGTLPGHPECGEELFVVEYDENENVTLHITVFSRPATLLARACGPLTLAAQRLMTRRYGRALKG